MGIEERRTRERDQRRKQILAAAWKVAARSGWALFSMERAAAEAELGRATLYGYFESFDELVSAMADEAVDMLSDRVGAASDLIEALDAPVRFAQLNAAAFALLFQDNVDARDAFSAANLGSFRQEAQQIVGRLRKLAARAGATLPEDAKAAEAFLAGISMAAAVVPELRSSTPLRRRWQHFCLDLEAPKAGRKPDGRP